MQSRMPDYTADRMQPISHLMTNNSTLCGLSLVKMALLNSPACSTVLENELRERQLL